MKTIHLVDDEKIIHDIFRRIFKKPEFELTISENKAQALANHGLNHDVVIMDLMIPGTSGLEIFAELKKDDPEIKVIFLTAFGTIETAIEAIKMGACDYLQKPFNNVELKHKIERSIQERRLTRENRQLKQALNKKYSFSNIIGNSPMLLKSLDIVESVADTNSTVLISGESGTGKELIAQALHQSSNRRNRPFVSFNSSNIPATLFESLLFGYKKGAFTGAYSDKKGYFEEAHQGTIFIDEIGNLTPELQAKILRVIQEKEFQPLGANKTVKVDVRIIAATNVNLLEKVQENSFREDLYYRLNIINIHLPPLRERKEDIPLLAETFLERFSREHKKQIQSLDQPFISKLVEYDWPGNVRELENAILRCVLLASEKKLRIDLLPREIIRPRPRKACEGNFYELVSSYKRQLIIASLEKNKWVQKRSAEDLQIKPSTLSELMKKLNIQK